MNFSEYEKSGRAIYANFANVVAEILDAEIKTFEPPFRYQYIQRRAKEGDSLRKKLIVANKIDTEDIGQYAKDLAGCRIIFYSNADVTRFLNSSILRANFEIDRRRTKPHYPIPGVTDPSNQFRSDNIVVKLKEPRTTLSEYADFRGLWCEVQVQTILNHAWSETAHDITYKRPTLKGVGTRLLTGIDERLQKIMKDHLSPAGYEFQKALDDYDLLLAAQRLVDDKTVDQLLTVSSNNDRKDFLEKIRDSLIPNLDDALTTYPLIRDKIAGSIEVARTTEIQPFVVHGVQISDGTTFEDYLDVASEALQRFRYIDVPGNIEIFLSLFAKSRSDNEREKFTSALASLAKNNLSVWQKIGPQIQVTILSKLEEIPAAARREFLSIATRSLGEILDPEIDGTTSTYHAVTISFGVVPLDETTSMLRNRAIDLLIEFYIHTQSWAEKRLVIQALTEATKTPTRGSYSDDSLCAVIENSRRVAEFYLGLISSEDFEIRRIIEKKILWLHRSFSALADRSDVQQNVAIAAQKLNRVINDFRKVADANEQFLIFKILIGYDSVYPSSWTASHREHEQEKAYREASIEAYVDQISVQNLSAWSTTIARCAEATAEDFSAGSYFFHFLKFLGTRKPALARELLLNADGSLTNCLHFLFEGIHQSDHPELLRDILDDWILADTNLNQIAIFLGNVSIEVELLKKLMAVGIAKEKKDLVHLCFRATINRRQENIDSLEPTFIQPAFRFFNSVHHTAWIDEAWFLKPETSMLGVISIATLDLILENLISLKKINDHAEWVLSSLAERFPNRVIDYFGRRLDHAARQEARSEYRALPYEFHRLKEPLAKASDHLLDVVRRHYVAEKHSIRDQSVRLLTNVFPDFPADLQDKLRTYARSDDDDNINFVLEILRDYPGAIFIDEICKELVAARTEEDSALDDVRSILWSSGVVAGEFGFVDALKAKIARMNLWLEDDREKVRNFAISVIESFSRDMMHEQRRAEEDLEMGKRQWGE